MLAHDHPVLNEIELAAQRLSMLKSVVEDERYDQVYDRLDMLRHDLNEIEKRIDMLVHPAISTRTTRRDEVKPGDIFQSSHGYRLLVTEVIDDAPIRTGNRHVQINGHLHANPDAAIRSERYPANSTVEVEL